MDASTGAVSLEGSKMGPEDGVVTFYPLKGEELSPTRI